MALYQITIALAILMVVIEIFTTTFLFLGFGVGLLVLVPIHYFTDTFSFGKDAVIFSIASLIAFVFFRKIFRHKGDMQNTKKDVNQY
jgi:membrane protein implicated in regulation of membrane protease activity